MSPSFGCRSVLPGDGDIHALERIFTNIIGNYFIHGEGPLTVEVEDRQEMLCIRFTNRLKPGSSVDTEKIFTRFYRRSLAYPAFLRAWTLDCEGADGENERGCRGRVYSGYLQYINRILKKGEEHSHEYPSQG